MLKGKYNILISVDDWEGVERIKKRLGCIIGPKLIQPIVIFTYVAAGVVGGWIEHSSERRGRTRVHTIRRKNSMVACLASSCGCSYLFAQLMLHSPDRPIGMLPAGTMWAQEVEDA